MPGWHADLKEPTPQLYGDSARALLLVAGAPVMPAAVLLHDEVVGTNALVLVANGWVEER